MSPRTALIRTAVLSLALSVAAGAALADDTEIFTGATGGGIQPNIMFIIDTSGSMSTPVVDRVAYDPTVTYAGGSSTCDVNSFYFVAGSTGTPPACNSTRKLANSYLKCVAGANALGNSPSSPGFYTDNMVQWKRSGRTTFTYAWNGTLSSTTSSNTDVACQGDYPANSPYASTYNGPSNTAANEFTTTANKIYWNNGSPTLNTYTIYSGNYLNWYNYDSTVTIGTRISVVQSAATSLINSMSNVNIGLMRYSNDETKTGASGDAAAQGGMVVYPISPVATGSNRTNLITALNSYSANGWTPLSETMYEAYLYFSGGQVHYGNTSVVDGATFKSVPASRVGGVSTSNQYQTPIQYSCQKNFVVFLTDGLPTEDNQADSLITALPNEATLGGSCDDTSQPPYSNLPGGWGPSQTAGKCLSALTKYMFNADINATLSGQQNVQTYFIGFGNDPGLAEAFGYLQAAASKGGGQAYTAGDLTSLQQVLTSIVSNILQVSTTFTAPTVAVNAFNRTQTLNDLYVSVFQPSSSYHWPGNVKHYSVQNDVIVDANGLPAVDPATGFFKSSAQSIWSPTADGASIPSGGAANLIPNWDPNATPTRNLYTYVGANPVSPIDLSSSPNYALTTSNPNLTPALLATSAGNFPNVINFARGEDIKDFNGNGIINEPRHQMGDPLHAQPAVVIYGGTTASPDVTDAVIYAPTNDGFLHAFSAADGHELWAFIPQEVLPLIKNTYGNNPTPSKNYMLDGSVRVLKYDVNGDGIVDPSAGDRVILYFGQGRGGSTYYAIDVTDRNHPTFMWSTVLSHSGAPGSGQAWSTPALARVNISGGAQVSAQKIVLVIAGGYDVAEETPSYTTQDTVGMGLYMLDAVSGSVLWTAGFTGSGADLVLARMDHAIPSDVAVLDTNGDGFADRMYVGDLAGQLWRFDITNGNGRAGLVAGGVIASLGAHDEGGSPPLSDTRRFYNVPDVAVVEKKGTPTYMNIAIGSGYRGHPLSGSDPVNNPGMQDRMYAIRDKSPFTPLTQAQYNSYTIIHDADLTDITASVTPTVPPASPGWKLLLNQPANNWVGEKVLTAASTFNDQIMFTTYTTGGGSGVACTPSIGTNRFYAISVFDGSPVANLNNHNNQATSDRWTQLAQSGIAPSLAFLFPAPTNTMGVNGQPVNSTQSPVVCMSGVEVLGACRSFQSRIKTYWNEADAP
jgi:type IV pilus assembly protein PilY1